MIPKFRAWFDSEMYDEPVVYDGEFYLDWREFADGETYNDAVLMQSTGLFDTFHQDELFEDDVILWTYFDEFEDSGNARIVYRDGCWKLLDIKTGKEVWDSLFECLENCNVYLAGNIYENPELVEGSS
ncbi:hypothetical protein HO757_06890 [Streptococcus suis]|uniref:Phage protein n=1 Tax=Streptococcus suis TaxID=1307 RepID=A0A0Z8SPA3_STRSU|nr:YopX family protein [Streptococcus suis]NQP75284.1 hypothetical protein [Streptococcus suis]NQP77134.1 hypothetical protein [Streptococcus suis]NQP91448.1 hypothetical protein [Streptococcus suis]NQP93493.1 hypothetical protein [Streptococcus suis]NQS64090.1 hypothetical protein [Streptococcus suis]